MRAAALFLVLVLAVFAEDALTRDDIRKYAQQDYEAYNKDVKKTVEDGVKTFAHVHHSLARENDKIVCLVASLFLFLFLFFFFSFSFLSFLFLFFFFCFFFSFFPFPVFYFLFLSFLGF